MGYCKLLVCTALILPLTFEEKKFSIFPHPAWIILTLAPVSLSCSRPFDVAGKQRLVLSSRWSGGYTVKIWS
jgi:hypothetical protein